LMSACATKAMAHSSATPRRVKEFMKQSPVS
jgi:hypothetical protein